MDSKLNCLFQFVSGIRFCTDCTKGHCVYSIICTNAVIYHLAGSIYKCFKRTMPLFSVMLGSITEYTMFHYDANIFSNHLSCDTYNKNQLTVPCLKVTKKTWVFDYINITVINNFFDQSFEWHQHNNYLFI